MNMRIDEFNRETLADLSCDGCPLGTTRVGMDSADGEAGPCRILFMGLNPGRDEARVGRPFVGKSGMFLREAMKEAGIISGWAIVNSILCSTANESEIPDVSLCREHCRKNVARFFLTVRPSVVVPCGNGAAGLFGLGSGITANAKKVFVSRGPSGKAAPVLVMPILHPSGIIRNGGRSAPAWPGFLERLKDIATFAERFDPKATDYGVGRFEMLFQA